MNFKILVLATKKFNYVVLSCFIQLWSIEKIVFEKAVFSHFPRSFKKGKAFYTNFSTTKLSTLSFDQLLIAPL